jgi:hypothetical protein
LQLCGCQASGCDASTSTSAACWHACAVSVEGCAGLASIQVHCYCMCLIRTSTGSYALVRQHAPPMLLCACGHDGTMAQTFSTRSPTLFSHTAVYHTQCHVVYLNNSDNKCCLTAPSCSLLPGLFVGSCSQYLQSQHFQTAAAAWCACQNHLCRCLEG